MRRAAALTLLLAGCAGETPGPAPQLVAAIAWEDPDERHGGLSGLEASADGRAVVAITDRSVLVGGRIVREAGRPVAVETLRHRPLRAPEGGGPLRAFAGDSEGLAVLPTGEVLVSFEGYHRVWRFRPSGRGLARVPLHDPISALPTNEGPEALAVDGAGRPHVLPEGPVGGAFPVWRFDGAAWAEAFRVPQDGPMKVVGADFGPDGRLYLLERRVALPVGFRSRVRSVAPDGTGLRTELETPPGRHGNLEGLAVWRDGGGAIRLLMVADDNFVGLQRGELVEYRLPPTPSG